MRRTNGEEQRCLYAEKDVPNSFLNGTGMRQHYRHLNFPVENQQVVFTFLRFVNHKNS